MSWLTELPFAAQLALLAVLFVAESGLLLGVLLPSAAVLAAMAAQVADQPSQLAVTIAVAAAASVTGGCLGYWRVHSGASSMTSGRWQARVTRARHRAGDRLSRRPSLAAAVGQCFAGARTLTPRLAADASVPLSRVLRGTVPASVLWASGIATGGALVAALIAQLEPMVAVAGPMVLGHPVLPAALLGALTIFLACRWPEPPARTT